MLKSRGLGGARLGCQPRGRLGPDATPLVTVNAFSPFGRGANAPLAGLTILQIVPPLSAGGDERSTLAVAAALIEAGARALVASDPGELASEVQALGGLHLPFPASDQNPLAMTLNVRRLARILDFGARRSRSCALARRSLGRARRLPQAEASAGDDLPGRGRRLIAADELRIRCRRRRPRDRFVAIRGRPRRRDFPGRRGAAENRASRTGPCEARA